MLAGLLLVAASVGQSQSDPPRSATQPPADQPVVAAMPASGKQGDERRLHDIRLDVTAALRGHALADDDHEKARWAHELVALHREITSDSRFAINEFLQQQRGKVWSRLVQIRDEIKRKTARAKKESGNTTTPEESLSSLDLALADHYTFADQLTGGPSLMLARGGGAVSYDYGNQLVELIQNTISPSSWNVNGGRGSIIYYRPGMALVVRATSTIHEQLGGVLDGLR